MPIRHIRMFVTCTVLVFLSSCAPNDGMCHLTSIGDLKVLNDFGSPIVGATLNGQPVAFMIDTGAQFSMVNNEAAQKYQMDPTGHFVGITGVGGTAMVGISAAQDLKLGDATARTVEFLTDYPGQKQINGVPIIGLIGNNVLMNYDIVLNLPDHRVNLYLTSGCNQDNLPLWVGASYPVHVSTTGRDYINILLPILLNGHHEKALLDSGSSTTLINRDTALDAGLTKSELDQGQKAQLHGVDNTPLNGHLHTFQTLQIGPLTLYNQHVPVADTEISLIGAPFLWTHRVWISQRDHMMYIQPTRKLDVVN